MIRSKQLFEEEREREIIEDRPGLEQAFNELDENMEEFFNQNKNYYLNPFENGEDK